MSYVKVSDIAYGRLRVPDLDVMEEFLTRFGMVRSERTANALYMRGTDPAHHIHISEKGDPKFIGLAYYVDSEDDLARLAKAPGASGIESMDEPGGGKRVRLTEPNGYQIEVVTGIASVKPIEVKRQKLNSGELPTARAGELMRLPHGPAHVKRIGHGVLMSSRFKETVAWFRDTLGMICSDDVYVENKDNLIGSFNRCDRGDTYVDHHVFFCLNSPKTGLNHMSFEVPDIEVANLEPVFEGGQNLGRLRGHRRTTVVCGSGSGPRIRANSIRATAAVSSLPQPIIRSAAFPPKNARTSRPPCGTRPSNF